MACMSASLSLPGYTYSGQNNEVHGIRHSTNKSQKSLHKDTKLPSGFDDFTFKTRKPLWGFIFKVLKP